MRRARLLRTHIDRKHRQPTKKWSKNLIFLFLLSFSDPAAFADSSLLLEHSAQPLQAESIDEALIPWETPISGFFVRSHHSVPVVDESKWILKIDGLVDHPLTLTLKDLKALPQKSLYAVLECSGNARAQQTPPVPGVQWQRNAVGNAQWNGVSLATLLQNAGVKSSAHFIQIEGADRPSFPSVPKFIRNVPLSKAIQEDTLLALKMNREPIPILHGGPIRLILPGWYGENWIKWLVHITLTEKEDTGFYMKKGYRVPKTPVNPGESWDSSTGVAIERIKVQSLITSPLSGKKLAPGKIPVRGKAFSGERTISKVEISTDQGKTWKTAEVESPRTVGGWQEFHTDLNLNELGKWTLISRATDNQGDQQPLNHEWNPGGYVRNAVDSISFETQDTQSTVPHLTGPETKIEAGQEIGKEIYEAKCQTCHSKKLPDSQRLTAQQWAGVIKKMEGFGVQLENDERTALLGYLQKLTPSLPPTPPTPTDYKIQNGLVSPTQNQSHGNPNSGKKLFEQFCIACHGNSGEGKIGPRLLGKSIPKQDFITTVLHGKRTMPPFKSMLKKNQIEDIRSYLQQSLEDPT